MTEGRPPKEGASNSEPESQEDAQSGRRSQTRSVAGRTPSGSAAAPRATFSPATSGAPKASPGSKQTPAPRSVFQQGPTGHPPTSSDPDKTVKRPYPTAPSTWGQTLPIGDLLPGKDSALFPSEEAEKTVQVARSAFVKTLISAEGLTPPTPPESLPARAGSTRTAAEPAGQAAAPDEPLTIPSTRPAPTPWQQSRAAAPTGTMLMPGSPGAHDDSRATASADRHVGAASHSRAAVPAAPAAPARVVHASAKQTLPLGSAITAEAAGLGAAAPELPAASSATRPAAPALRGGAASERANAAATGAKPPAARAPVSAASARTASIDGKNVSEPLQLRISAHDVVPKANFSERPVLPRSRGPLVAALLIATLIVLGAIAWFGLAKPAAPVAEPTRNDAVTVPMAEQPAAPVPQQPAAPAQTAQPVQPTAARPAATAHPTAQPPQAPATGREQQPTAQPARATATPAAPKQQPAQSAASRRRAERRAAARRQAAQPESTAPATPAADVPEDVQEARDALRALDSEPVIKINPAPTSDDLEVPDFPSLPEPPEPPPPAPDGE